VCVCVCVYVCVCMFVDVFVCVCVCRWRKERKHVGEMMHQVALVCSSNDKRARFVCSSLCARVCVNRMIIATYGSLFFLLLPFFLRTEDRRTDR